MSLADLIARGGAVPGELNLADAAFSGLQAGQQAQARRLQSEGMAQENQARGLANLAASQQQDDLAAMRQAQNRAVSVGPGGELAFNQAGYLADIVQGGRGGIALAEQARLQAQQAAAREAQIAQAKAQHKAIADVLYGVKGPMDFAAALPALEKMGVDVSDLRAAPFRNDWRDVLQAQINIGLDVGSKLQIEEMNTKQAKEAAAQRALMFTQGLQSQQFALDQQQAAEAARSNRAKESIDWYRAKNPPALVTAGVAKAPAGYRYTPGGDLEAIPGGPADAKKIEADAKAVANAQKATQFADQGIGVIDKLLASPGLGAITGLSSKLPIFPGTNQAQADALAKQLEGQAFLQAFQSLKGGGAITEKEGEKATAAMARLQRTQSTKDYKDALGELRGILQTAKDRTQGSAITSTKPKVGDEKTVNGVTGVWDGTTWRRK
jgi:hypothetical protein